MGIERGCRRICSDIRITIQVKSGGAAYRLDNLDCFGDSVKGQSLTADLGRSFKQVSLS